MGMKFIDAELIGHPHVDQQNCGHTRGEAHQIDEKGAFISAEAS